MAKSVWFEPADIEAFKEGRKAASQGAPRTTLRTYLTYNERAAFNDGWDSFYDRYDGRLQSRPKKGPSRAVRS